MITLVLSRYECAIVFVRFARHMTRRVRACDGLSQEAVDYLGTLESDVARAFLTAIGPLLRLHRDLRDYVAVALRKAVFSRNVTGRITAVNGFLFLLEGGDPTHVVAWHSLNASMFAGL